MGQLGPITPVEVPIVETERLRKVYGSGDVSFTALHDVDVSFGRGEFTAIMGPSGSGKSTLMHCTAGLDTISSGIVKVNGVLISSLSAAQRTVFRRDNIGFIFQAFNLIPSLNAEENITLPSDIAGRKIDRDRFDAVISALGIGNRLKNRPAELSGGQQQRVACARALVSDAAVVFADEPTGNLDSEATEGVLGFIRYAVDELGQSVIMVTHEPTAAAWADRVVFLRDGDVHAEMRQPTTDSVLDALRTFSADPALRGDSPAFTGGRWVGSPAPATVHPNTSLSTPSANPNVAHTPTPPSGHGILASPTPTDAGPYGQANALSDLQPRQAGTPTVTAQQTPAGATVFSIPGLGAVTVSGDVHLHVYDPHTEHPDGPGLYAEGRHDPSHDSPDHGGDAVEGESIEFPTETFPVQDQGEGQ